LGLSEEAKSEYLREKIKQAKRTGIIYYVLSIVGLAGFLIGFIGWAFDLIIMGVALFVVGIVMGFYSNRRKNNLMEQLRKMGYKEKQ
jgi:VIT1/CCC1 family predicted Fe2+/Mn2+ transporter